MHTATIKRCTAKDPTTHLVHEPRGVERLGGHQVAHAVDVPQAQLLQTRHADGAVLGCKETDRHKSGSTGASGSGRRGRRRRSSRQAALTAPLSDAQGEAATSSARGGGAGRWLHRQHGSCFTTDCAAACAVQRPHPPPACSGRAPTNVVQQLVYNRRQPRVLTSAPRVGVAAGAGEQCGSGHVSSDTGAQATAQAGFWRWWSGEAACTAGAARRVAGRGRHGRVLQHPVLPKLPPFSLRPPFFKTQAQPQHPHTCSESAL